MPIIKTPRNPGTLDWLALACVAMLTLAIIMQATQ